MPETSCPSTASGTTFASSANLKRRFARRYHREADRRTFTVNLHTWINHWSKKMRPDQSLPTLGEIEAEIVMESKCPMETVRDALDGKLVEDEQALLIAGHFSRREHITVMSLFFEDYDRILNPAR